MAVLKLTKGLETVVDDADAHLFDGKGLRAQSSVGGVFYAMCRVKGRSGPEIAVHRLLMGSPKGKHVDHINGDTLDNRRSNLRVATNAENQSNRGMQTNNTSGFKGVVWDLDKRGLRHRKPWKAQIQVARRKICLGYFATAEEAARAYDRGAMKHRGDFARLNFPQDC